MEKLKMHSKDLTQDNLAKIQAAFPNCVTERQNAQGEIELAVDFDLLRRELSSGIVEGPQERYRLDWPGKREAMLTANAPIAKTLRPARDESVSFDDTENLFIEGDNLDALKLLQETYLGKVKMIYIDPPYNTGNDFVYEDDFAESTEEFLRRSNQKDELGHRLVSNPEFKGRFHSVWLSMMFSRLRLARSLLTEDGVVFVSIGDEELDNLLKLLKEVYGEDNFITTFLRQRKKKPSFLHSNVGSMYEYVVCIAKNRRLAPPFSVDVTTLGKKYPLNNAGNSLSVIKFPAKSVVFSDSTAIYEPQDMSEGNIITKLLNKVTVSDHLNNEEFSLEGEFRYSQRRLDEIISNGETITISKVPFRPNHIKSGGEMKKMHNHLTPDTYQSGTNEDGSLELDSLFKSNVFDNPKPSSLIKVLCKAVTYNDSNALVLDFFAGSSSSAHAVMQLNAEDGGNRNFIMVQLPEQVDEKHAAYKAGYKTIAEISKERIRRAGAQILEGECHADWNKDIGFRVLKVDTSNMQDVYYQPQQLKQAEMFDFVDNIKPDRTGEDLLFQVLLDWGVDLTLPIRRETIQGKDVFIVDDNALVACFEQGISEALIHELAALNPLRAVFRDNGFASDDVKINVTQIFKQNSPITDVKAI